MNELWEAMSKDMRIVPFHGENEGLFHARLGFSGLGLWCLKLAQISEHESPVSKQFLSRTIDEIASQFCSLDPSIKQYLTNNESQREQLATFIRRLYEETGYLLVNNDNRDELAFRGRTVATGRDYLFYGLPETISVVRGLGIYSAEAGDSYAISDSLIRDDLEPAAFFQSCFNLCDFTEKDVELDQLEYFDPRKRGAPSTCWGKAFDVDATIARKHIYGPYYRVIRHEGETLFWDEPSEGNNDSLTSGEYRRLYFALRVHYNNPVLALLIAIDETYSEIRFQGFLPNREYYLLLLMAWPKRSVFDKAQFIIHNDTLDTLLPIIRKLGVEIRRA